MTIRDGLILIAVLAGASLLAGCATVDVGTERSLGAVKYDDAFSAARTVLGQYFTVASADADSGIIEAVPQPVAGRRLSGATRQIATVKLRRSDTAVTAYAMVAVQRQSTAAARQLATPPGSYDGPPHQTPGELEAATTAEQNEAWMTERRDRALEEQILADIVNALQGRPAE